MLLFERFYPEFPLLDSKDAISSPDGIGVDCHTARSGAWLPAAGMGRLEPFRLPCKPTPPLLAQILGPPCSL